MLWDDPYNLAMTHPQVTFEHGLWNGRRVSEWVPVVVEDVVDAFDPERIIVFGSVARGDQHLESDLDLLVLFDNLDPSLRRRLMGSIRAAITAPIPVRVDVVVADVSDFERRRDVCGSPYYWPAQEGRVVYDRSPT